MSQTSKTIFLIFCAGLLLSMFVVMCKGVMKPAPKAKAGEAARCDIYISSTDLIVKVAGTAPIDEVVLRHHDTVLVSHSGCGGAECNYPMVRYPHDSYHATFRAGGQAFEGDFKW